MSYVNDYLSDGYFLCVKFNEDLRKGCARLKQTFEEYDNIIS